MMKFGDKITFEHDTKRGYGRCDRLYLKKDKGYVAVDFGEAGNEYQHSVAPIDGEYKKIAEYLQSVPVSAIEKFLEKNAKSSPCGLYTNLWTYEMFKKAMEGILNEK